MKLAPTLAALIFFVSPIFALPTKPQQLPLYDKMPLDNEVGPTPYVKVPGDNSAHYCGKPEDQLFGILEFDLLPEQPRPDHHFFLFLSGEVPKVPGLDQATFTFTVDSEEAGHSETTIKLADAYPLQIRKGGPQGGREKILPTLTDGLIDLIWDGSFPREWLMTGTYTFTISSHIPDGRTLFCLRQTMYLEGGKAPEGIAGSPSRSGVHSKDKTA